MAEKRLAHEILLPITDIQTLSSTAVDAEVQERISVLGPGGYILAPANHLQLDVLPENVVALCEAARKYGWYPLQ